MATQYEEIRQLFFDLLQALKKRNAADAQMSTALLHDDTEVCIGQNLITLTIKPGQFNYQIGCIMETEAALDRVGIRYAPDGRDAGAYYKLMDQKTGINQPIRLNIEWNGVYDIGYFELIQRMRRAVDETLAVFKNREKPIGRISNLIMDIAEQQGIRARYKHELREGLDILANGVFCDREENCVSVSTAIKDIEVSGDTRFCTVFENVSSDDVPRIQVYIEESLKKLFPAMDNVEDKRSIGWKYDPKHKRAEINVVGYPARLWEELNRNVKNIPAYQAVINFIFSGDKQTTAAIA